MSNDTCSDDTRKLEAGSLTDIGDQLVGAIEHLFCCKSCKNSGSQSYWAIKIGKLIARWEDLRQ